MVEVYPKILEGIKIEIRQARLKAALSANAHLLALYWQIGNTILEQQQQANWGGKLTERLSDDLRREFPDMKGFSHRNIKYMRQFAATYPSFKIGQPVVAQLPWAHHVVILDKVKDENQRLFYMKKALENG